MKRRATSAILAMLLAAVGLSCMVRYPHPAPITREEVIMLVSEEVSDQVIMNQIDASHTRFFLSSEEILELREAGVSEPVIVHMIRSTRHPGSEWERRR